MYLVLDDRKEFLILLDVASIVKIQKNQFEMQINLRVKKCLGFVLKYSSNLRGGDR